MFPIPQPNGPSGKCAGPGLTSRQGVAGLQPPLRRATAPVWLLLVLLLLLLLMMGSGPVRAADTGLAGDAHGAGDSGDSGAVNTLHPAAADLANPSPVLWSWRVTRATLPVLAASSLGGSPAASPGRVVQTMVWLARPLLQWGLGVEQRWALPGALGAATPAAPDVGLLVGLRLDAGPRAQLIWQAPVGRPDTPYGELQPRQMRVALALLPQDPYADLRRGLLTKVELSGQTMLALRPRGGRLGVQLTSHW